MNTAPPRQVRRTSPAGRAQRRRSFSRSWRRAGAAVLLALAPLTFLHSAQAASKSYSGADQGDWDTGTNWTGGLPGTSDTAANTSANTVVHSQNVTDTVNGVNFTGTGGLTLSGGTLAGSQANDGSAFSVVGTFYMNGGILSNFTVAHSNAISFANNGGNVLQNVTLDAGLTLGDQSGSGFAGYTQIAGTFKHGTGAAFNVGYASTLYFDNDYTLDNASLNFAGTSYYGFIGNASNTMLTLGPNLTVSGKNAYFQNGGSLTNQTSLVSSQGTGWYLYPSQTLTNASMGVIGADGTTVGSSLNISAGSVGNAGLIEAIHGATVGVSATTLTNTGSLEALSGGTLTLAPTNYGSLGTVIADGTNSVVNLQGGSGTGLTTAGLGSVSATNGGTISLETTLDNTGATLNSVPFTNGTFEISGGAIKGGTIANSNSLVFANNGSNVLQNVTLAGTGGLTLGDQVGSGFAGYTQIAGTFSHGAGASFNVGYASTLYFANDYTLDSAALNFTDTSYYGFVNNASNTTLTLGPNLTVSGKTAYFQNYGSLTNDTSLVSSLGGNWYVYPSQTLTNAGTIGASGMGSTLNISTTTLANTGTISATGGGSVSVSPTNYSGIGIVTATGKDANGTGSVVHLAGGSGTNLTTPELSGATASGGGAIYLETTLDNTGTTLDPQAIGNLVVNGGTILSGTIANSNALGFSGSGNNTLQGVTLAQGLTLGDQTSSTFAGYTQIAGTFKHGTGAAFNVGYDSVLYFDSTYTLNNAALNFNSPIYYGFVRNAANTTLTLGSGLTASGKYAQFDGSGSLVNQGVIDSSGGQTFNLYPSGSFANSGTVEALNGSTVNLSPGTYAGGLGTLRAVGAGSAVNIAGAGPVTLDGSETFFTDMGGAINLETTLDNTGSTFDPVGTTGGTHNFVVSGGTILGGAIANSNALGFSGSGSNLLQNVTLAQGLTLGDQTGSAFTSFAQVKTTGASQFTHGAGAAFNLGYDSTLVFDNSYTLNNASLHFTNPIYYGFLDAAGGTTLTLGPTLTGTGQYGVIGDQSGGNGFVNVVNQGSLSSNSGGNWYIRPNGTLTNSGTIQAINANSTLQVQSNTFTNSGTLQAVGGGAVTVSSTGTAPTTPVNTGVVAVGSGSTMTFSNGLTQTATGSTRPGGPLIQIDGTLALTGNTTATDTISLQGGTLEGSGVIQGSVVNTGGTVNPGDSPGTLTITSTGYAGSGNYAQGAGGALNIEYTASNNPNVTVANDKLAVQGVATLGGVLNIIFQGPNVNGIYQATPGENGTTFDFLTFGTLSNTSFGTLFSNEYTQNGNYFVNGIAADNAGGNPAVYQLTQVTEMTQNGISTNALQLSLTTTATPEPSQWAAFGLGALGLGGLALRARRRGAPAA